jgi:transcriptional regulator with XRE-family HTH domain
MNKPWAEVTGERRLAEKTEKAAVQLRERRLARKLTQEALAKELGVTANAVARWERCERPIPHWVTPYLSMQQKIGQFLRAFARWRKPHGRSIFGEGDAGLPGSAEQESQAIRMNGGCRSDLGQGRKTF